MISVLLSRLVLLVFGTLYPAYASYKTVKTKNVRDYVKWMMYWIVFALYTFIEVFADIFIAFWFPFYYELKILFVLWLICPATRGSTYIFKKIINPQLSKHEEELDTQIASLWDHGYDVIRKIGSQGVEYLGHLMIELLRKGQITAFTLLPNLTETAQSNTVIQQMKTQDSNENIVSQNELDDAALDDEDFDILMVENPELYNDAIAASSSRCDSEKNHGSDSDSALEDLQSVKRRSLKLAKKSTAKVHGLRERKKKNTS